MGCITSGWSRLSLPAHRRFGHLSPTPTWLLALLGLNRAPCTQTRAGNLDLSLLTPGGRALALVVAVQNEDLAIAVRMAEDPQDELLRDFVVRLDGAIDAELEQPLSQL